MSAIEGLTVRRDGADVVLAWQDGTHERLSPGKAIRFATLLRLGIDCGGRAEAHIAGRSCALSDEAALAFAAALEAAARSSAALPEASST